MPDEPPSQMIRVPTPLVDAVRELSRLHRLGHTKAVLEGIERLVAAIDSELDIDIDSVLETISRLTERLEQLESEQSDSRHDIDIDSFLQPISERLEKIEIDIESIALTIADLNVRLSNLEGVGDMGYTVTPNNELEPSGDISQDSEVTPWQQDLNDISSDIEQIAEPPAPDDITSDSGTTAKSESPPQPHTPLTQSALAMRLGISDKTIQKHRQKGKESFAQWTGDRDPDSICWTWEGTGGRGQPLRFVPLD
jgi:hypothetical protein